MTTLQFTLSLVTLFISGFLYSFYQLYLENKNPASSLFAHFLQWTSFLFASLTYFCAGYFFQEETPFSSFGVLGSIILLAPIGYVFGRKFFQK